MYRSLFHNSASIGSISYFMYTDDIDDEVGYILIGTTTVTMVASMAFGKLYKRYNTVCMTKY